MEYKRGPWTASGDGWSLTWSPVPPYLTGPEDKVSAVKSVVESHSKVNDGAFMIAPSQYAHAQLSESSVVQLATEEMARDLGEEITVEGDVITYLDPHESIAQWVRF